VLEDMAAHTKTITGEVVKSSTAAPWGRLEQKLDNVDSAISNDVKTALSSLDVKITDQDNTIGDAIDSNTNILEGSIMDHARERLTMSVECRSAIQLALSEIVKDISTKISQVPLTLESSFNSLAENPRISGDNLRSDISGVLAIVNHVKATVDTVREDSTKFATSAQIESIRNTEAKTLRGLLTVIKLIETIETGIHSLHTQGLLYSTSKSSKAAFDEKTVNPRTYLEDMANFLIQGLVQNQSGQVTMLQTYLTGKHEMSRYIQNANLMMPLSD
jgi:hypothetical protein